MRFGHTTYSPYGGGTTGQNGYNFDPDTINYTKATLSEKAIINSITFSFREELDENVKLQYGIYTDENNYPKKLIGATDVEIRHMTNDMKEYTLKMPKPFHLSDGDYWIAFYADGYTTTKLFTGYTQDTDGCRYASPSSEFKKLPLEAMTSGNPVGVDWYCYATYTKPNKEGETNDLLRNRERT